jgi:hypothetical protein
VGVCVLVGVRVMVGVLVGVDVWLGVQVFEGLGVKVAVCVTVGVGEATRLVNVPQAMEPAANERKTIPADNRLVIFMNGIAAFPSVFYLL